MIWTDEDGFLLKPLGTHHFHYSMQNQEEYFNLSLYTEIKVKIVGLLKYL